MAERSWTERFSNFWGRHKDDQEKQSIISKLSDSYERSQAITRLNMGVIKFSPPKPVQPEITWSAPPVNTGRGSVVPSPSLDQYYRFWKLGQSPELIKRRELYAEYDYIFNTSVLIATSAEELTNGAFRKGVNTKIVPAEGYENDAQAEDMAGLSNEIWSKTKKLVTPEWFCLHDASITRYGNGPFEIVANDNGAVEELRLLSPYAMQINSNIYLKFDPGQRDAYIQFDDAGRNWIARWPEALIVYCMTKDMAWHRYGMGRIFAALTSARALIRAEATLPDSREAGQLQKFERYSDSIGNPVPRETIEDAQLLTDEALKTRNEQLSPFRTRIYNGAVEVGMIAPPTGFYNEIDDIRWHAGGVASRFGTQLARQQIPETMNRATLDRIDEMAYVNQSEHAAQISDMTLFPVFERQVAWYNGLMETKKSFYLTDTVQSKIDLNKVKMQILVQAQELPERLIAKAELATVGYDKSLLDWKSAVTAHAMAQGRDPDVVMKALIGEGRGPKSMQPPIEVNSNSNQRPVLRAVN